MSHFEFGVQQYSNFEPGIQMYRRPESPPPPYGQSIRPSMAPATSSSHQRASSVPSSPTTSRLTPYTTRVPKPNSRQDTDTGLPEEDERPRTPTILQPRVAVVLNVPRTWHPWLFALRLASILPAIWWGTPSALRLALRLLELLLDAPPDDQHRRSGSFPLTEMTLATIWCFASGYLSFYFTDCLMSRWLMNYTPQATVVRLLTINTINAYSTSMLLSLAGGFEDARLLLPGWIGIATTLTVCYHLVHQKINIRKETSTSVSVFSFASYFSMVTLLGHLYYHQPSYPKIPLVSAMENAWQHAYTIWNQTIEQFEEREL